MYITLLSTCMELHALDTALSIVTHFEQTNMQPDIFLQTVLVKTYSKLGDTAKIVKIWQHIKVILYFLSTQYHFYTLSG